MASTSAAVDRAMEDVIALRSEFGSIDAYARHLGITDEVLAGLVGRGEDLWSFTPPAVADDPEALKDWCLRASVLLTWGLVVGVQLGAARGATGLSAADDESLARPRLGRLHGVLQRVRRRVYFLPFGRGNVTGSVKG
jgi:hypothetical protein